MAGSTGDRMAIIGKTLGHADLKSTQVYSRLQLDPVKEAVGKSAGAMLSAAGMEMGEDGTVKLLPAPADKEATMPEPTRDEIRDELVEWLEKPPEKPGTHKCAGRAIAALASGDAVLGYYGPMNAVAIDESFAYRMANDVRLWREFEAGPAKEAADEQRSRDAVRNMQNGVRLYDLVAKAEPRLKQSQYAKRCGSGSHPLNWLKTRKNGAVEPLPQNVGASR